MSDRRALVVAIALAACGSSSSASHDATSGSGSCGQGLTCAPAIPSGWAGYVALYDGAAGAPSCGAGYGTDVAVGSANPNAPDATCSACTCGPSSASACTAGGGSATIAQVSWAAVGQACSADLGAVCGSGGTCVAPAAPRTLCIQHAGDMACPAGSPFATPYVLYGGVTDTRGCTACTCGAPTNGACPASGGEPTGSATPTMPVTYCCT